jgi:hypothetical protein
MGRRATIIGVVLSLLIPGLGHAYLGHLTRALIWFAGTVLLAIVVGGGDENAGLALAMGVAIGVCAAIDTLVIRRTG